ncbi:MAG: hypothetical protein OMM_00730 [Candidatus Magnetoglobus multicellularis str. Araruama]|uniref:AMIN domain-containing protein n=1 Tax=Candidatus Magnetoglobus multicellularis str. Araruama TaxID=890399 RepID=A0A1V1PFQ6_9BACT|nr:MAG: hypothetical protein OMM_00730 [Candidatus Magnetoglobus multicellularis str. Araruama]
MKQSNVLLMLIIGLAAHLIMSMPQSAWAEEKQLMEISSENLYDGSIKVLFILTEVSNPKMSYYKTKSAPKVVCDFYNVKVKPGLKNEIRVNKHYVKDVRLGEHHHPKDKVRVVLDLIPGHDYTVKEVPPEPNIFSVIIRSEDIAPETRSSISESRINTNKQDFGSTVDTTQQTITTTIPDTRTEEIIDNENLLNESIPDDDDDSGNDDDDFAENDGWIENLIESNVDQQAPNKWPVEKNYGNLKMIVHLDTDPNGFISLKGYVINMSDDFLYRIQLDFDVVNENADTIEQAYAEFFNVEPGERRKMSVHVALKTASNFRLMQKKTW